RIGSSEGPYAPQRYRPDRPGQGRGRQSRNPPCRRSPGRYSLPWTPRRRRRRCVFTSAPLAASKRQNPLRSRRYLCEVDRKSPPALSPRSATGFDQRTDSPQGGVLSSVGENAGSPGQARNGPLPINTVLRGLHLGVLSFERVLVGRPGRRSSVHV